jgi:sulfur carrier protein ThiS
VGKLLEKIFAERVNRIGMVAINGKVVEGRALLADGDRVDVYELLGGG